MEQDDNVKFIRLQTGEDLISEVTEIREGDEWHYILHSPLKIIYSMGDKPSTLSVAMMEWVFSKISTEQEFPIYPSDIITMITPSEEFVEYYWEVLDSLEKIREEHNRNIEFASKKSVSQYEEVDEEPFDIEKLKDIIDNLKNMGNKRKLH